MNPETKESEEDLRRIIEVLQTQVASMQTELDEVKAQVNNNMIDVSEAPKPEPEPEPETREEVIEYMKKIPGIGLYKANLLYDNGFDSTEKLKTASVEDLIEVPGIGRSLATRMHESIEKIEAGEAVEKPAETAPSPPEPEGEGAMGFIKNTFGKVLDFFKGKKPEPAAEPAGETKEEEKKEEESERVGEEESESVREEKKEEEKEEEPASVESETSGMEEPVEITSEEPKELTKDDIIKNYQELTGIPENLANALYDAGYESLDELKEAEEQDLQLVEGIGPKTAEDIVKALKE